LAGVRALMARAGARSHVSFGGRLSRDAKDFQEKAMARKIGGDLRDTTHVRRWTKSIAAQLRGEVREGV
jgi:menaquinone-dependent protoporphyrinogen oxidase